MSKPHFTSLLARLSLAQRIALVGVAVGMLLTLFIFMPGGLLSGLTGPSEPPQESTSDLLIEPPQENDLATGLTPEKNAAYLTGNAAKQGVKVTDSGLQYRVISPGAGKQPTASSEVTVHYTGRFIDGRVFDSSVERGTPATFSLDGVIRGWTEGLQLMKEGGKAELVIPHELAYGAGRPGIPPYQTLVFEVELIKVN